MVKCGKYEVSFSDDCGENEGGIYCEVYEIGCDDNSIDYFAIPNTIQDEKEREEYAKAWVRTNYIDWDTANDNFRVKCGKYEVSFSDDCDENEGGIYCEVYEIGCDDSIADFEIPNTIQDEKEREEYAKAWVRANYFV